jgi:hypothetical protein
LQRRNVEGKSKEAYCSDDPGEVGSNSIQRRSSTRVVITTQWGYSNGAGVERCQNSVIERTARCCNSISRARRCEFEPNVSARETQSVIFCERDVVNVKKG